MYENKTFRVSEILNKIADFDILASSNLISRKIKAAEKFVNFHIRQGLQRLQDCKLLPEVECF